MSAHSENARLEAFSDGVFAIAITLLVLDMKIPPIASIHSITDMWKAMAGLWPSFFALTLSFIIILISWIGHHNMFSILDKTSATFQFANGFFLFTIILYPFSTAYMSDYLDTPYAQPAIVLYCACNLLHNIGWNLLHTFIVRPVPLVKEGIRLERLREYRNGSRMGFVVNVIIVVTAWWMPYLAITLSFLIWLYWIYLSIAVRRA
jgi:uncharacterized membrane protein